MSVNLFQKVKSSKTRQSNQIKILASSAVCVTTLMNVRLFAPHAAYHFLSSYWCFPIQIKPTSVACLSDLVRTLYLNFWKDFRIISMQCFHWMRTPDGSSCFWFLWCILLGSLVVGSPFVTSLAWIYRFLQPYCTYNRTVLTTVLYLQLYCTYNRTVLSTVL